MRSLLLLEYLVQEFVDVHFQVRIEAVYTFMARELHAVGDSHLLHLHHVCDLRRSEVVALEVDRFD